MTTRTEKIVGSSTGGTRIERSMIITVMLKHRICVKLQVITSIIPF